MRAMMSIKSIVAVTFLTTVMLVSADVTLAECFQGGNPATTMNSIAQFVENCRNNPYGHGHPTPTGESCEKGWVGLVCDIGG